METKRCTTCSEEKPIDQFGFSRPNAHRANCKKCQNEYTKEYRKKNPDFVKRMAERRIGYFKKYRQVNKKQRNEYLKEWHKKNPEKKRSQKYRHLYGINVEDYNKMLIEQGSVCAICGSDYIGRKGSEYFVIDHCHKTGEIRGLLCHKCNMILGLCNDNPDILLSSVLYLKN